MSDIETFLSQASQSLLFSDAADEVSQQQQQQQHQEGVLKPVTGKDSLYLTSYTQHTLMSVDCKKRRSRTAVLSFPLIPLEERAEFVRGLADTISRRKMTMARSFGFELKTATHFVVADRFWVVLVSSHSLPFSKWFAIFDGLGASDIQVLHYVRMLCGAPEPVSRGGVTDSGFNGVADLFDRRVTVQELLDNHVDFACDGPRSTKRARTSSQQQQAMHAVEQAVPVDPIDELVQSSQSFLSHAVLTPDLVDAYAKQVGAYLQGLPDGAGSIGLFLLSGRPLEMFAQYLHLKDSVVFVLESQFGFSPLDLTSQELASHFMLHPGIDSVTLASLHLISSVMDLVPLGPVYPVFDQVSALFFSAVYILGRHLDGSLKGGSLNEPFLHSFAPGIAEMVQWFAGVGHRMNVFLTDQLRGDVRDWSRVGRCMFAFDFSEDSIKEFLVGDCRALAKFARAPAIDVSKYHIRRTKLDALVLPLITSTPPITTTNHSLTRARQVGRVYRECRLEHGAAHGVWKALFGSSYMFRGLSVREPLYRLLPATGFTDDAALHSPDIPAFARGLCSV